LFLAFSANVDSGQFVLVTMPTAYRNILCLSGYAVVAEATVFWKQNR